MWSSRKLSRQDNEMWTKRISTFQTIDKELSNWKKSTEEEDHEGNCAPEAIRREFQEEFTIKNVRSERETAVNRLTWG